MAFDSVPWLVGGGAEHSPEVGRLLAYAATSGASGIVSGGDLAVRAQTTPAGSVRIAPGAVVIPNKWSGQQTYLGRNATDTTVTVPATGGAARADLVVVRIDDPQYAGSAPADPKVGPYIRASLVSGVSAGATKANVTYPHVVLARINVPANTAVVTSSMITDLREMANPRRERRLLTLAVLNSDADSLSATGAEGERWPNTGGWDVQIPEWATRVRIVGTWGQLFYPGGDATANLWVYMGWGHVDRVSTQHVYLNTPEVSTASRSTCMVADDRRIPHSMRGESITFDMRGRLNRGNASSRPVCDGASAVVLDLEFLEAPDEDE